MAGWRQAVELAMTDDEIKAGAHCALSKRSGASGGAGPSAARVRETPSFFAVGQMIGVHHQS